MTLAALLVIVAKVAIVLGFLLNMAAISIWADRRQSAMVQHRVGPNRAVVTVPSPAIQAILFGPALIVGGGLSYTFWQPAGGLEVARITTGLELAILVSWFSLLLLAAHVRKHGADTNFDELVGSVDPRNYFYGGLAVHLAALPLARLVPTSFYEIGGVRWATGIAGTLAAVAIWSSGLYAAAKVPPGKTELRLAGTLHALADALKLIWKEDLRPANADKWMYEIAPMLAMFPALVTFAVLPFGSTLCFVDTDRNGLLDFADLGSLAHTVGRDGMCAAGQISVPLQVADLNVGLLYIFAIAGTGIIGAALAGWASDSKFALLGGLRATSQMVSYEVALGLSIVGVLMICGSVHMKEIVDWQGENTWGIFVQPFAFFLFIAALVAETKRVPFDQPEGESEIVAGYFLEYSGMKFGLFFMGEYAEFIFSSALVVTLFFGGYHLPFLHADGIDVVIAGTHFFQLKMSHFTVAVIHVLSFFGKTILMAWLHVFIRWTLPRFRYDQLMKLGWTKLLPLALANIVVTGVVILAIDGAGPGVGEVLTVVSQVTQGLVAFGGLLALVAAVTWLLEPPAARRVVESTAARYAEAAGGVQPTEMQA